MSKLPIITALAIAGVMSFGTAMAQPAVHVVPVAFSHGAGHIMQIELKATDDEANPTWVTPNYTPAQVAAASHNGDSTLNSADQETNPGPAPGYDARQLATVPNDNGPTDLNPYDNAA